MVTDTLDSSWLYINTLCELCRSQCSVCSLCEVTALNPYMQIVNSDMALNKSIQNEGEFSEEDEQSCKYFWYE